MERRKALSLVVRLVVSRAHARRPRGQGAVVRPRRHGPDLVGRDRGVAGGGCAAHAGRRSCCPRCGGRRCSTPSRSRPGCRRLMSHYLAGQFVSNVLPTTIGGDVLRVSRLSSDTGETPGTFASVVLERLTGWLVLPVITIVGFAVNPGLRAPRKRHPASPSASPPARCCCSSASSPPRPATASAGGSRRRDGWRRFPAPSTSASTGCAATRRRRQRAGVGFAYQLALVLAAVAAAQALGLRPGRPHRAAGVLPRRADRPGAADLDVGARRARRCVRAVPRPARRGAGQEAIALGLLLYLLNLREPARRSGVRRGRTAAPAAGAAAHLTDLRVRRRRRRGTRRGRRPRRPARPAPACAGGARSATSSLVYVGYSAVRNQFGSGAGSSVDPEPRSTTPRRSSSSSANMWLYFEDAAPGLVPRPAGARPHPLLERLLRHRPLHRHGRRPGLAVPRAARALPGVAQHAGRSPRCSR